jgi:hypothetical protein
MKSLSTMFFGNYWFISCIKKKKTDIKLFYLYQSLQCRDKYFFEIKFVFFLYLRLWASSKENDVPLCIYFWYQTDSGVPNTSIYSAVSLASAYYNSNTSVKWDIAQKITFSFYEKNSTIHLRTCASHFSCLYVWKNRQATSGIYAITGTTSAYHSRRCGRS